MTGTVALVEDIYELKETLIVYDFDDNVWVEKLVPVDEPDALYFLTAEGNSACEDIYDDDGNFVETVCQVLDGEEWLLDFGPEWYAADPCLVESYICEGEDPGGVITMGPFVLGDFTCTGAVTTGVVSNDPEQLGASIPLMSRDRRDDLPYAGLVYAFGRSGGSEIVWIWDDPADDVYDTTGAPVSGVGEFVLYPKAGSNIVWEIDDDGGQAWWRGEALPQAMTSELSCEEAEEETEAATETVEVLTTTSSKQKRNR